MLRDMDMDNLLARAQEGEAALRGEGATALSLQVSPEAASHPVLAGEPRLCTLDLEREDGPELTLHAPGFAALPEVEREARLRAEIAFALEEAALQPPKREPGKKQTEALYLAHARFKAGAELPRNWHRAGTQLAEGIHAVDLDLFVELALPRERFEALRGQTITLHILEETLELELPEDADGDEVLTLAELGLFDEDLAQEEDDPVPATGDLHLLPLLYE
jgi:hypothetical protein